MRPIKWKLIEQHYDEIIQYTTALRLGTGDPESILRRFTRTAWQQLLYQALIELGKVYRMIFVCEYLRLETLRREIHEGLNVIENWNGTNGFIFYGRGSEITTNQREDQETAMLCLHLLQIRRWKHREGSTPTRPTGMSCGALYGVRRFQFNRSTLSRGQPGFFHPTA